MAHACSGPAASVRTVRGGSDAGQTLKPARHMHARAHVPGLRYRRHSGASPNMLDNTKLSRTMRRVVPPPLPRAN